MKMKGSGNQVQNYVDKDDRKRRWGEGFDERKGNTPLDARRSVLGAGLGELLRLQPEKHEKEY
jgi:hypothetical protein